ncbi:hypothetical protein KIW84_062086 [Lathyrus oleraceus]|uniref:DUF7745 domain-containing protein n=1 Tax=Pisum sativum TaxID=3888 RepID=A0A9D4W5I8_PEA|nr:hypothetical protein KIW84_062086 [Pisum sativum]
MDYRRRNTKKYGFRCPDLKELKKLSSFVLDPLDFKQRHGKLLSVLSTDVVEGLLSVLVQFYNPLYRCFTFPGYQLVPTLEEYAHLLGMPISEKVPFSGLKEIPRSHIIAEALHLKKSEVDAHLVKKGGILGLTSEFLIGKAIVFAQAGSMDAFEAIFVLLIYGLTLFPNIDGFVDVNAIRIFLIGNLVPTLLGDIVDIINSCGEFSNVPLIGTQGGINYNPALACRQLGFPLRDKPNNTQLEGLFYQEGKDPQHLKQWMIHALHKMHRKGRFELGLCNCVALEAYTIWVKKRDLEMKMSYACEIPMSLVVVEPSTLPNQDIEELEDALTKMKEERDTWEERFHALSRKHKELQLESKDKDALIEILEDRVVKR